MGVSKLHLQPRDDLFVAHAVILYDIMIKFVIKTYTYVIGYRELEKSVRPLLRHYL